MCKSFSSFHLPSLPKVYTCMRKFQITNVYINIHHPDIQLWCASKKKNNVWAFEYSLDFCSLGTGLHFQNQRAAFEKPCYLQNFCKLQKSKNQKSGWTAAFWQTAKMPLSSCFFYFAKCCPFKNFTISPFAHLILFFFPLCGKDRQLFTVLYLYRRCHMTKSSERQKFWVRYS